VQVQGGKRQGVMEGETFSSGGSGGESNIEKKGKKIKREILGEEDNPVGLKNRHN